MFFNKSAPNRRSRPYNLIAAANTNPTVVLNSAGWVTSGELYSLDATPVYLKFYDKATTPDENDTPVAVFMIPSNAIAGNGSGSNFVSPIRFSNGIAFRTTTGIAAANTGALSANEVVINFQYLSEKD